MNNRRHLYIVISDLRLVPIISNTSRLNYNFSNLITFLKTRGKFLDFYDNNCVMKEGRFNV